MVFSQKILNRSWQVLKTSRTLRKPLQDIPANYCRQFSVSATNQSERRFTKKHEWVTVSNGIGTIGISHYAQESLGDVVFAQLPDVGTSIKQNEECGALESVKAASELFSPVSGTIVEKNTSVEDTPGLINTSCYEKGWLFKVKLSSAAEVDQLMDEKNYEEFLKTDSH